MIFEHSKRQEFNEEEIEKGAVNSEVIWRGLRPMESKIPGIFSKLLSTKRNLYSVWGHEWTWEPKPLTEKDFESFLEQFPHSSTFGGGVHKPDPRQEECEELKEAMNKPLEHALEEGTRIHKEMEEAIQENNGSIPKPDLIKYNPAWQGPNNYISKADWPELGIQGLKSLLQPDCNWGKMIFIFAQSKAWWWQGGYKRYPTKDINAQIFDGELIHCKNYGHDWIHYSIEDFIRHCQEDEVCVIKKHNLGFQSYKLCPDYKELYDKSNK